MFPKANSTYSDDTVWLIQGTYFIPYASSSFLHEDAMLKIPFIVT